MVVKMDMGVTSGGDQADGPGRPAAERGQAQGSFTLARRPHRSLARRRRKNTACSPRGTSKCTLAALSARCISTAPTRRSSLAKVCPARGGGQGKHARRVPWMAEFEHHEPRFEQTSREGVAAMKTIAGPDATYPQSSEPGERPPDPYEPGYAPSPRNPSEPEFVPSPSEDPAWPMPEPSPPREPTPAPERDREGEKAGEQTPQTPTPSPQPPPNDPPKPVPPEPYEPRSPQPPPPRPPTSPRKRG